MLYSNNTKNRKLRSDNKHKK